MADFTTFTVIPSTWEFDDLNSAHANTMIEGVLADMYKAGLACVPGVLILFIHGEFDSRAKKWRLHGHGLVERSLVPMLDKLRELPKYKACRVLPGGNPSPVWTRVWIRRKPLVNIPDPLTYLLKSYWPSRPIYFSPDGKRSRMRKAGRIREPYHSQSLLWLNRWRLTDLTLMIGLRVGRSGLVRTKRSAANRLPSQRPG